MILLAETVDKLPISQDLVHLIIEAPLAIITLYFIYKLFQNYKELVARLLDIVEEFIKRKEL